ncbi:hypothetical protein J6590_000067 [Homalodisca vitripennis]|nr:hypothetical protein J6590_000067 [Homalodisca vitripennis]
MSIRIGGKGKELAEGAVDIDRSDSYKPAAVTASGPGFGLHLAWFNFKSTITACHSSYDTLVITPS